MNLIQAIVGVFSKPTEPKSTNCNFTSAGLHIKSTSYPHPNYPKFTLKEKFELFGEAAVENNLILHK